MDDATRDALLDLQARAKSKNSDVASLMTELLERFGNELWQKAKDDCEAQLRGYQNSTDYYLRPPLEPYHGGYMPIETMVDREREGRLGVVRPDGEWQPVHGPLSARKEYFVNAPIADLQNLLRSEGDEVAIEMPELTQLVAAEEGGKIMLLCAKSDVQQIVDNARRGIGIYIHIMLHPDTWDKMDELSRIKRERQERESLES